MYHFLKGVIPHFALITLPLCHTLSLFLVELPPLKACDILFEWRLSLLYNNIVWFSFISSFEYFTGINFCYLEFTKVIAELIFAVTTYTKILQESMFTVALRKFFFHHPILWFWEINTFYWKEIINGLEKTWFKRYCIRRKL